MERNQRYGITKRNVAALCDAAAAGSGGKDGSDGSKMDRGSVSADLAPLLEEPGPVAAAVGAPQVAAARRAEAAVVPPVIAAAAAPDARSSGNINQRRTSEKE